ncbi:hypothetical protein CK203_059338 [Vitis vinifera]|uniref:Reverse transcriptase RNase H-like domain-containing protein n=1 Tax=Vitis vinifera TaxID=29760 RepID=A0A438H2L9_VITVI|nr:hypothetical protein CK203_059338 [Vitis vinifera]
MIGGKVVEKALLDLGASVNLLPYSVYKQLGLGELKPTSITLSLADRSVKIPRGIIEDVLVQVDNFYYPVDFVVLDTDPLSRKLIMFLSSLEGHSLLPQMQSSIQITPEEEEGPEEVCIIDTLVEEHCWRRREEILPLFNKRRHKKLLKKRPKAQFEASAHGCLLEVLKRCKKAIGWQISDLKGISPLVCTHHIYMEEEAKPIRQPQRRLNPHLQEVVRVEVLKLLQAGIIYPISDSPWVSPTQVVPKKSGITVVQNEKGEEITTRLTFSGANYGGTFEECLVNLEAVLNRCIEEDLVLNWEKCNFMVHQGIVLGHIISEKGIEVDKSKDGTYCQIAVPNNCKRSKAIPWPCRQLPFEVMCDASDFAIEAVLGQREDGKPMVFHHCFTDHSALKYLLTKQDAKARLIRWILLLQEFDLQIRDKKGVENVVADHLQVTGEVPSEWKAQDRKHFFAKIHAYYWEESFLFKYCADQIIRKCVPEEEQQGILSHCHESACGGHFASQKTAMKVFAIRVYLAITLQRCPHHV